MAMDSVLLDPEVYQNGVVVLLAIGKRLIPDYTCGKNSVKWRSDQDKV